MEWQLFYDMTNSKLRSGKILHIQQRDNHSSLCGRDVNYGLPISFPVATPICPNCAEIKVEQEAAENAELTRRVAELEAERDEWKEAAISENKVSVERWEEVAKWKHDYFAMRDTLLNIPEYVNWITDGSDYESVTAPDVQPLDSGAEVSEWLCVTCNEYIPCEANNGHCTKCNDTLIPF